MKKASSRAFNIGIIILVAVALLRPSGPVGARIVSWSEGRRISEVVAERWSEMASSERVDTTAIDAHMVDFVDYECRICRAQHVLIKAVLDSGARIGIAVRHYPLSRYRRSEGAARAAICAANQGRFPAMHDRLFTTEDWISDGNWEREALEAGVSDIAAFSTCLSSDDTTQRLQSDMELGSSVGVRGTPAYILKGGERHIGSMTSEELRAVPTRAR